MKKDEGAVCMGTKQRRGTHHPLKFPIMHIILSELQVVMWQAVWHCLPLTLKAG